MEAMEHGNTYQYLPVTRTRDYVLSAKQFELLEGYVQDRMAQAADRILSGSFGAKPFYRGASHDPCAWCDYAPVCQKDPSFRKSCYQAPISARRFWELLEEGEK